MSVAGRVNRPGPPSTNFLYVYHPPNLHVLSIKIFSPVALPMAPEYTCRLSLNDKFQGVGNK